jgi:radical SAM protein
MDFNRSPLLVIWETTQACDLTCVHCRASAQPGRHPDELTTAEGFRLLDEVKRFGEREKTTPLMVFTGGDPIKRPDLFELIRYSVKLGLRTNVSPSATPLLTPNTIQAFKGAGVARMAISVDGWDAASHDAFRGIPGTFDRAIQALRTAQAVGLETQFQTTVTRLNMGHLGEIAKIAEDVGAKMWSLFFLIVTGRARREDDLSAEEYEQAFEAIWSAAKRLPFDVKTTEAMHYRRFVARKLREEKVDRSHPLWRTAGVSDAKGFVFISHVGDIYPSGFLPLLGGNVRTESLVDVYRNSTLFQVLRDADLREGKCGCCEYRNLCGGSRARAYAMTGNFLAEDPRCAYQPEPVAHA